MKLTSLPLFASLLFISCINTGYTQTFSNQQIDSVVNLSMQKMPQAGMAVLVVKDGKVVHAKGYGVTSAVTNEKVNEHTRFAIASNSKAFTTSALALLVDQGKLNWTDKVVDYVPEFKMYNPYITANFTILDLLTHRSGLGLGAGDLMFFPDGGDFKMIDILKSFQYQTQVSDFRTKYDYDNLLYVVAGEVITRISGKSWSEFVEQNLMKPLAMNESAGTYQRLSNKQNIAQPHHIENGKIVSFAAMDIELGAAAGGIYTSISDLSKWVTMHLNDGAIDSVQLISKKNHDEMWKPHTNMAFKVKSNPPYNSHFVAYGLGWQLSDIDGHVTLSHTGGLPGMLSKTTLIPDLNLGIVVLTNCDPGGYSFHTISGLIADAYMGIKGNDWISIGENAIKRSQKEDSTIVGDVWKLVELNKVKPVETDKFVGKYKDDWFGEIEIRTTQHLNSKTIHSPKNGKDKKALSKAPLYIECLRSPKLQGWLYFYNATTFAVKWDYTDMPCDAFVTFQLDKNGKATGFKMEGISPNIDFSFDFQDLDVKRID